MAGNTSTDEREIFERSLDFSPVGERDAWLAEESIFVLLVTVVEAVQRQVVRAQPRHRAGALCSSCPWPGLRAGF